LPRTVILTGAYGYLGSVLRARLEAASWTTVALVRTPRGDDAAVPWALGDRPPDDLLAQADALVHCAYDFTPRTRDEIWRVNVEGTTRLLDSANRQNLNRVLVLSSMSAYPSTKQLYGRAKLAIERVTVGFGGIAIRPGLVYGDTPAGMAGALSAVTKLPLVPVLGGDARQFPVHQDDFADAILEVIEAPGWTSEVFGVAQPTSVSFRALLASLAQRQGRSCRFVTVPWRAVYWSLRLAEMTGASLPLRSDSLLGLVHPAPSVPSSTAFPNMLAALRTLSIAQAASRAES
jgi:nucleoside-diphosphate-sugar epimerase